MIIDANQVLREYDLGKVDSVLEAGGTAGKTWKVSSSNGDFFLRLRGARTSGKARLEFDHGLREHLTTRGVPTVSAVLTKNGARWVYHQDRVFELYPFVNGSLFCPDDESEIVNAAQALARFHEAGASYRPPSSSREVIAQYTVLGFSNEVSDRMEDPRLLAVNIKGVRNMAQTPRQRQLIDRCAARIENLMHTYVNAAYDCLAGWVIHGDYTPANLLFSDDGKVVGIFDLDWAVPGARCRDVADALYFFASEPRRIDSSDIWSLTDAAAFDLHRCLLFLDAYQEIAPLCSEELKAIPWAFAARWFSIRLEGMAKVKEDERFRFFSRDIEKPLQWLDKNWKNLTKELNL